MSGLKEQRLSREGVNRRSSHIMYEPLHPAARPGQAHEIVCRTNRYLPRRTNAAS